ncbi:hypothetical protein RYH80_18825 [Halobaculum sp. MBLA0147]|uniref:hypothetical protein n=1 Tax=Halobaculum sp. MBLA0147 TaxID=3079934 RepID=UPI003525FC7C
MSDDIDIDIDEDQLDERLARLEEEAGVDMSQWEALFFLEFTDTSHELETPFRQLRGVLQGDVAPSKLDPHTFVRLVDLTNGGLSLRRMNPVVKRFTVLYDEEEGSRFGYDCNSVKYPYERSHEEIIEYIESDERTVNLLDHTVGPGPTADHPDAVSIRSDDYSDLLEQYLPPA